MKDTLNNKTQEVERSERPNDALNLAKFIHSLAERTFIHTYNRPGAVEGVGLQQ